VVSADL